MADGLTLTAREQAFYRRYGGVALGLRLLNTATERVEGLAAPNWVALSLDDLRSDDLVPGTRDARRLATLEGCHVALKFSGARESFSPHVNRGVNSSTRGPGPFVSERGSTVRIAAEAAESAPDGTCAIILQEMVTSRPPFDYLTVHATDDRVVIESRDAQDVAIFESTRHGSWFETRNGTAAGKEFQAEFEVVAEMHRQLVALLGFDVNTEGFRKQGQFFAIQLRPVPQELPADPSLTGKVWQMAAEPDVFVTHFVHGFYDVRGVVSRRPEAGSSIGLFVEPPRLSALSDVEPYVRPADLRVLQSKWPLTMSIWLSRANIAAEKAGASFLALDTLDAFHLSHDIVHLPPAGNLRVHLRYAACGPIASALADGAEIEVVSDGNYAAIRRLG